MMGMNASEVAIVLEAVLTAGSAAAAFAARSAWAALHCPFLALGSGTSGGELF